MNHGLLIKKMGEVDKVPQELTTDLYYDLLDKYVNLKCDMAKVIAENKIMRYEARQFRVIAHKDSTAARVINNTIKEMIVISHECGYQYKFAVEVMKSKLIKTTHNNEKDI